MDRCLAEPRRDWRQKFDALGFVFHSADGGYWDESACYKFSAAEIDVLEDAAKTLHELCLEAVEHVVTRGRYEELDIPQAHVPLIEQSWRAREPSLYGRFDLCYDGRGDPKLLEYNADTPTSVLEAAVAQWHWLEETGRGDQFNSLHEKLIERWRFIGRALPEAAKIHFSCVRDNAEDFVSLEYLRDVAMQVGCDTALCFVEDIGWNGAAFVDLEEQPIDVWFKLYPWEWLMREAFGEHLARGVCRVIEPAWKAVVSNKGLLPILWELNPGHPNLLPAYREPLALGARYAMKPLLSREGANITLIDGDERIASDGPYGGPFVYQALAPLPRFGERYPVLGCWIVGDEPAGLGIREGDSLITTNASRFVPHFFE